MVAGSEPGRRWAYSYSRWDGTQKGFDVDADRLLAEMSDELLAHGDIERALRRLMQQGFADREGNRVEGLRELMERLAERRREMQESVDLGAPYAEIARELDEVVAMERSEIDSVEEAARESGDERRREVTEEAANEHRMQLELMPDDLAGRVRSLEGYEFMSSEARERLEEVLEKLRQQVTQTFLDDVAGSLANQGPEEREHIRAALDALNRMLEQRAAGEELDPGFEAFMAEFGDLFPGNPQSLDELLEQMAARMAAVSSMLASMTPGQRAQLESLFADLMGDMDLQWQLDRLGRNLRSALPDAGWDTRRPMHGTDPFGLSEATDVFRDLADLDRLEQMLGGALSPASLAEVDLDKASELLGPDAGRALEQLAQLAKRLEEAGVIENKEGRLELTPRGIRQIGNQALSELFKHLTRDRLGGHEIVRSGAGRERAQETKPYEFGDPFDLNIERTLRRAIVRRAGEVGDGPALPVRLHPDDFEVERTEELTRTSTVLMIDLSLSMPMQGNFIAAKKVAMALQALISSQYPRDYLGLLGFSVVAREIEPHALAEVSWDYEYGTNMQHALMLARRMLGRESGTKQILMITDGEPTAHLLDDGTPIFHYPPVRETVQATLTEVMRCTRAGIRINTFTIGDSTYLRNFVEHMTRINRGRAFFTTPDTLGDYVLVDFIEQRRALSTGARSRGRRQGA